VDSGNALAWSSYGFSFPGHRSQAVRSVFALCLGGHLPEDKQPPHAPKQQVLASGNVRPAIGTGLVAATIPITSAVPLFDVKAGKLMSWTKNVPMAKCTTTPLAVRADGTAPARVLKTVVQ